MRPYNLTVLPTNTVPLHRALMHLGTNNNRKARNTLIILCVLHAARSIKYAALAFHNAQDVLFATKTMLQRKHRSRIA